MPPKTVKEQQQNVTPATLSTIRPGTQVVPLTTDEADVFNEVARQQGIATAEAMKKITERLPQTQPKPTITEQSLGKIQQARELSLTSADPNDPLNQMMRYGFYQDLKKDFKRGNEERMSSRERMDMLLEVGMMRALLPREDGGAPLTQQFQQMFNEMKAENEKQRLFYEAKLKEQEDKIREMMFEKKIQTLNEKQEEAFGTLKHQLDDVSQRLELYNSIPTNVTSEEKKDAVTHLENLGKEMKRIKNAFSELGIIPASSSAPALTTTPGSDPYKKQDGTTDYLRYTVDKIENTVGKITEAWQKKTPERKQVAETPVSTTGEKTQERRLTPEEYADFILSKSNPSPQELEWLNEYRAYLAREQAKLGVRQQYKPQVQESKHPVEQPAEQPVEQQVEERPRSLTTTEKLELRDEPKKSVIDRLKEQEEEEIRRTQGLL